VSINSRHRYFSCLESSEWTTSGQRYSLSDTIADLTHAIVLDPACWSAYRHRGIVHAMRGDHDASFQDYLKTRELTGDQ
jgi:hypothetical protein